MRLAFSSSLAIAGRSLCWLALVLGLALPAAARTKPATRHQHIRLPKMLPTIIPAAREGYETVLRGRASWYGKFFQGKKTSSGERYDRFQFTCAHKTLPFGTRLRVTNLTNGLTVVVRVSDRGPFRHERILDLSERAARPLGVCDAGAATVVAVVVPTDTPLGLADAPDNLAALQAADPHPHAPFTAYLLPLLKHTDELVAAVIAAVPAPSSTFIVQAGLFADAQQAEVMLARISTIDSHLQTGIETVTLNGRRVRRVVVTRLPSQQAAEAVRRNLQLWGIAGLVHPTPATLLEAAPAVLAGIDNPAAGQ